MVHLHHRRAGVTRLDLAWSRTLDEVERIQAEIDTLRATWVDEDGVAHFRPDP
jgi:hypothetical protein